jgi:hypothetical protein
MLANRSTTAVVYARHRIIGRYGRCRALGTISGSLMSSLSRLSLSLRPGAGHELSLSGSGERGNLHAARNAVPPKTLSLP